LARAKREPIPDLQLRAGIQENGELLSDGRSVGLQGFADVGVRIPIFNRNQGNIATAKADVERARREIERVKLVLRERSASVVQNYTFSQAAVVRYKNQMIPRAQKAYEMYTKKYREMAAAYPQVLIAQRTLMQLEVSYTTALESFATSSLSLQSYLLTDGLEAPSQPGGIDQPVREVNIPFQMAQAHSKGKRMRKRTLILFFVAVGIVAAAIAGFTTIRRGFSARDNPSAIETYVAKTARRLSVSASKRNATNPFIRSPEVLAEARAHFADHCAICHGNDGRGKDTNRPEPLPEST